MHIVNEATRIIIVTMIAIATRMRLEIAVVGGRQVTLVRLMS